MGGIDNGLAQLSSLALLLGGGPRTDQYHVISIPTTLWIDPRGVVVATELDFNGIASLERKCKRLLSSVDKS